MLTFLPLIATLTFGTFQPYKNKFCNALDSIMFVVLELNQVWAVYDAYAYFIPIALTAILFSIPFTYMFVLLIYKLLFICTPIVLDRLLQNTWTSPLSKLIRGEVVTQSSSVNTTYANEENIASDDDIPDRLINPKSYQPLLACSHSSSQSTAQQNYRSISEEQVY